MFCHNTRASQTTDDEPQTTQIKSNQKNIKYAQKPTVSTLIYRALPEKKPLSVPGNLEVRPGDTADTTVSVIPNNILTNKPH